MWLCGAAHLKDSNRAKAIQYFKQATGLEKQGATDDGEDQFGFLFRAIAYAAANQAQKAIADIAKAFEWAIDFKDFFTLKECQKLLEELSTK